MADPSRIAAGSLGLLACVALASCALPTAEGFATRLSQYVGRSEADVVAEFGVPARTFESGGRRFLQFEERRLVTIPGQPYFGPLGGPRRFGPWGYPAWGSGPSVESRSCDVTFEVRDGRVESFSFRGNDCRAVPVA
jgi:hypothetical protein